jgi:hypothetical protein
MTAIVAPPGAVLLIDVVGPGFELPRPLVSDRQQHKLSRAPSPRSRVYPTLDHLH